MARLNVPKNIDEIIRDDGIWEYVDLEPVVLSAFETRYNKRDFIQYQVEFPSWEEIGNINRIFNDQGVELDGYEWETLIRSHLKKRDRELEKTVQGDSETETCVLWVDNKNDFEQMTDLFLELIDSYEIAKKLLAIY